MKISSTRRFYIWKKKVIQTQLFVSFSKKSPFLLSQFPTQVKTNAYANPELTLINNKNSFITKRGDNQWILYTQMFNKKFWIIYQTMVNFWWQLNFTTLFITSSCFKPHSPYITRTRVSANLRFTSPIHLKYL